MKKKEGRTVWQKERIKEGGRERKEDKEGGRNLVL